MEIDEKLNKERNEPRLKNSKYSHSKRTTTTTIITTITKLHLPEITKLTEISK